MAMPLQQGMQFDGLYIDHKKQGAGIAERLNREALQAELRHDQNERARKASKEYYVQQNGTSIVGIAFLMIASSTMVLWLSVCADRESDARARAIKTLAKHNNDAEELLDDDKRRSILAAYECVNKNFLFAMLCRAVNDSVLMSFISGYEGPFRRALESAVQQHWFVLALCITIIAAFVGFLFLFLQMSCTRNLWCGAKVKRKTK